jgi:hypothetical protein
MGYGIRVPGFMISPYAKKGQIDHQTLSFDAYLKFIEDVFLAGERLDPATDGRPDPRPTVRENVPILGNLASEFDFSQTPRPPMILPVNPRTTLTATVPFHPIRARAIPGKGRAHVVWARDFRDAANGGLPITGWIVKPFQNGRPRRVVKITDPKQLSVVVTGLQKGSRYTFRIEATNAKGAGYASAPSKPVTIK